MVESSDGRAVLDMKAALFSSVVTAEEPKSLLPFVLTGLGRVEKILLLQAVEACSVVMGSALLPQPLLPDVGHVE